MHMVFINNVNQSKFIIEPDIVVQPVHKQEQKLWICLYFQVLLQSNFFMYQYESLHQLKKHFMLELRNEEGNKKTSITTSWKPAD